VAKYRVKVQGEAVRQGETVSVERRSWREQRADRTPGRGLRGWAGARDARSMANDRVATAIALAEPEP